MKNKIIDNSTFEKRPWKIVIIVSRFNEIISKRLLEGALAILKKYNVKEEDIGIIWIAGAWEISLIAQEVAATKKWDAVLTLGTIIQGETLHHEYLAQAISNGLMQVSLNEKIPIGFGILTVKNLEQALARAGDISQNKGAEAAFHVLETLSVLTQISRLPDPS